MRKYTFNNNDIFNRTFRELSELDNHKLENLLGILNRISPVLFSQFQQNMVEYKRTDCLFFYYIEVLLDYDKAVKDLENKLGHIDILIRRWVLC